MKEAYEAGRLGESQRWVQLLEAAVNRAKKNCQDYDAAQRGMGGGGYEAVSSYLEIWKKMLKTLRDAASDELKGGLKDKRIAGTTELAASTSALFGAIGASEYVSFPIQSKSNVGTSSGRRDVDTSVVD